MLLAEPLTDRVIGLAIELHRHTGPGLLESLYRARKSATASRPMSPRRGRAHPENESLPAVQLRTDLRMSGIHVGLRLNFNVPRLSMACVATWYSFR